MSNNGASTLQRGLSVLGKLLTGTRKGPSGERARRLRKLQKRIGVRFTDVSLLEQALTHRSYSHVTSQTRNDSNERMEFLGDSVLGLAVSQFLYLEFSDRSEGALSKMKSLLVSRKVLSTVSRNIGIGEYLLLSGEESDMGGRDRTSILADSFEGLIGAIYLDQGYRAANRFLRRFLLADINEILKDEEHTNYKSLLQEYVQSKRLSHPVYRVRKEEGPEHEKEFAVDVLVRGESWGSGRGKSKKEAEQNAARAALERRQGRLAPRGARPGGEGGRRARGAGDGRTRAEAAKPSAPAEPRPVRSRGEHGIAASRERLRAQRAQEAEERRRAEREGTSRRPSRRREREAGRGPAETAEGRTSRTGEERRPSRRARRRRSPAEPASERGGRAPLDREPPADSVSPGERSEAPEPEQPVVSDPPRALDEADAAAKPNEASRFEEPAPPAAASGTGAPSALPLAPTPSDEVGREERRPRRRGPRRARRVREAAPPSDVPAEEGMARTPPESSEEPAPSAQSEPPDVDREEAPREAPSHPGSGFSRRKKRTVRGFRRR